MQAVPHPGLREADETHSEQKVTGIVTDRIWKEDTRIHSMPTMTEDAELQQLAL